MKVAITAAGSDLAAPLDSRFGRSPKFVLFDTETEQIEVIDNEQNLNAMQGAGVQSAESVARAGARGLITGHCGPKAFRVLSAAGIKVYTTDASTVGEAVERFRAGQLQEAGGADVDGHWM